MPNTGPSPDPNAPARPVVSIPDNIANGIINGSQIDVISWLNSLPTSDPGIPGAYYMNGGVLCKSQ